MYRVHYSSEDGVSNSSTTFDNIELLTNLTADTTYTVFVEALAPGNYVRVTSVAETFTTRKPNKRFMILVLTFSINLTLFYTHGESNAGSQVFFIFLGYILSEKSFYDESTKP